LRMNSPIGKKILSIVRNGDYAHPGEEEAIELVMSRFPPDKGRRILDVGCGRGGTAQYLQKRGWGKVVGFDIDEVSIAYAQAAYPAVTFVACNIYEASRWMTGRFDLICLFTTFYALPDQPAALQELRSLAALQGSLVVFDYLDLSERNDTLSIREEEGVCWNPIKFRDIDQLFESGAWKIVEIADISAKFCAWYSDLVARIEARKNQIVSMEGMAWYRFVHDFYGGMLDSIKRGILGGVMVMARPG
jgi:SAM-dependent methyltransferase